MKKEPGFSPHLLIASPTMNEFASGYENSSDFKEAVILLVEHNPLGALGFIINRPYQIQLNELLQVDGTPFPAGVKSWFGGPVEPNHGVILHNLPSDEEDNKIGENITLSATEATLKKMYHFFDYKNAPYAADLQGSQSPLTSANSFHENKSLFPFRFIIGYAGWGPSQLDEEIRAGSWLQAPLESELVFNTPEQDMWSKAMLSIGVASHSFVWSEHTFIH